jgi:putative membrane protein
MQSLISASDRSFAGYQAGPPEMTRAARWLLLAGVLLFVALLGWQGIPSIFSTLSIAGFGLVVVALFHVVPIVLDAAAIRAFFEMGTRGGTLRDTVMARWVGESANSLMPAGQLGGPVLMVRHLAQRGIAMPAAAAVITVTTTYQMLAQMLFALTGLGVLAARAGSANRGTVNRAMWISIALFGLVLGSFYLAQRRGLFRGTMRAAIRILGPVKLSALIPQAEAFDRAVAATYALRARGAINLALNLAGWFVGTIEVYLILWMIKSPVSWASALLLESLGQAIRGAAFVIPGSLGVQEGGYLLLAPLAGLQPEVALALSLAKRAREFLLGVPGLLYLHFFERRVVRAPAARRSIL